MVNVSMHCNFKVSSDILVKNDLFFSSTKTSLNVAEVRFLKVCILVVKKVQMKLNNNKKYKIIYIKI